MPKTTKLKSPFRPSHSMLNSRQEMQAISQKISDSFLAKKHHFPLNLTLLPIDPLHLYAYWCVQKKDNNNALLLRIYWHPEGIGSPKQHKLYFDVTLNAVSGQIKIKLPVDASTYSAELCTRNIQQNLNILIQSKAISVPRLHAQLADQNPPHPTINIVPEQSKQHKMHVVLTGPTYDKAIIDKRIKNALLQKQLATTYDQSCSVSAEKLQIINSSEYFNETACDALAQHQLTEKGRTLTPKTYPHFASQSPSGQNKPI